jgi:hypothetical protein
LLLTNAEYKALNEFATRQNLTASEIVRRCLQSILVGQMPVFAKKDGNE